MKYRDPTIRACRDVPKTVVVRRAPATPEPRVHRVPGIHAAPELRELPKVDRVAREPFNSREVRGEFFATKKYLE